MEKKEKGTYQFVDAAQHYNVVTICDGFIPPSCDEFVEDFAGMVLATLVDLFSGYDNFGLAEESRDITAFNTSIGSFQHMMLVQGATNSLVQAQ